MKHLECYTGKYYDEKAKQIMYFSHLKMASYEAQVKAKTLEKLFSRIITLYHPEWQFDTITFRRLRNRKPNPQIKGTLSPIKKQEVYDLEKICRETIGKRKKNGKEPLKLWYAFSPPRIYEDLPRVPE